MLSHASDRHLCDTAAGHSLLLNGKPSVLSENLMAYSQRQILFNTNLVCQI
jgi:hypothetical protein